MAELLAQFPRAGTIEWIGVRPVRRQPMRILQEAEIKDFGLVGDHRTKAGKRAVTLIQAEHLPVIASLVGRGEIDPALLRRNVVISGINVLGLKDRTFKLGTATLQGKGLCAPCSRMEDEFGIGGYNAMRGHGGIIATVIEEGAIRLGDKLEFIA
ncbi:MOSC domain-containing protein [Ahrensia kielensis]|uniref:MOSC domain-containing protein n=1 Tax=Ahrensia kielensis TaxID=76980 RepID=UPI000365FD0E|nr:MOSC domain-containing protein [Ahrensia kielensis]